VVIHIITLHTSYMVLGCSNTAISLSIFNAIVLTHNQPQFRCHCLAFHLSTSTTRVAIHQQPQCQSHNPQRTRSHPHMPPLLEHEVHKPTHDQHVDHFCHNPPSNNPSIMFPFLWCTCSFPIWPDHSWLTMVPLLNSSFLSLLPLYH